MVAEEVVVAAAGQVDTKPMLRDLRGCEFGILSS